MNLKTYFTIILIFTLISGAIVLKEEREDQLRHKCNFALVDAFIPQTDYAIKEKRLDDERINRICPKLKESCCSYDEFGYLMDQFRKEKNKLDNLLNLHDEMIETAKRLDIQRLKAYIDHSTKKEDKLCRISFEYDKLKKIRNGDLTLLSSKSELINALNYLYTYYASFPCEFCNANLIHNLDNKDNPKKMKFNKKNLFFAFNSIVSILRYQLSLYDLIHLARLSSCLAGKERHLSEIMNIPRIVLYRQLKLFEDCQFNKYDRISNKCLSAVLDWDFLNNSYVMEKYFTLLSDIQEYIEDAIVIASGFSSELLDKRKTSFAITPKFNGAAQFYSPNEFSFIKFDNLSIIFVDHGGWNIYENKVNNKAWMDFTPLIPITLITLFITTML